jgi:hypothetical protein
MKSTKERAVDCHRNLIITQEAREFSPSTSQHPMTNVPSIYEDKQKALIELIARTDQFKQRENSYAMQLSYAVTPHS